MYRLLFVFIAFFTRHSVVAAQKIADPESFRRYTCSYRNFDKKIATLKKARTDSIITLSYRYRQGPRREMIETKHILWKQGGQSYNQSFWDCEPSSVQLLNRVLVDTLFALYRRVEALPRLPRTTLHYWGGYFFTIYLRGNVQEYALLDYQHALIASKTTGRKDSTYSSLLDPGLEWIASSQALWANSLPLKPDPRIEWIDLVEKTISTKGAIPGKK